MTNIHPVKANKTYQIILLTPYGPLDVLNQISF